MPSSAGSHHSGADWAPVGQPPQQSPDLIYHEALRGALMLLRANGGEIATLDSTREALVSRSRQIYPRLDPSQAQAAPSSRRSPSRSTIFQSGVCGVNSAISASVRVGSPA